MTWWQKIQSTPARRQIDPIECGAVCLGIVLEYYGRFIDTKTLRAKTGVSRNGADAQAIIAAASRLGLKGAARKALIFEFDQIKAPAILFFDNCHFVVYEGRKGKHYYINDPARGHYILDQATFRKRYSHIALQFSKDESFVHDAVSTKWAHSEPSICARIFAVIMGAIAAASMLACARMTGLLESLSLQVRADNLPIFIVLLGACFASFVLIIFSLHRLLQRKAYKRASSETNELFDALSDVSPGFFDDRPWVIFERSVLTACERYSMFARGYLTRPFWWAFLVVLLCGFTMITPHFGLVITMSLFVVFLANALLTRHQRQNDFSLAQFSPLLRTMSSIEALKAMGHTELLVDGLMAATMPASEPVQNLKKSAVVGIVFTVAIFLCMNALALPLWRAADFSLSRFAEIIILGFAMSFAAFKLLNKAAPMQDETASLLRELQASKTLTKAVSDEHDAQVVAQNVSFIYPGEKEEALHRVSVSIAPGDIVGVVANSLQGTSTLFKILAGFLDATSGGLYRGESGGNRPKMVLINDESDIMAGTLKEVITLGQNITDEEVVQALKHAMATELFYNRPMGLLAPIKEHGQNLSVSERYRLLLAQAIVHKPDAVFLDDFFLSLDPMIATVILDHLRSLGITTVFNSYDGALLAKTSRVVFLHNRTVHKIDRHEHLYFGDAHYRELVRPSIIEDKFV